MNEKSKTKTAGKTDEELSALTKEDRQIKQLGDEITERKKTGQKQSGKTTDNKTMKRKRIQRSRKKREKKSWKHTSKCENQNRCTKMGQREDFRSKKNEVQTNEILETRASFSEKLYSSIFHHQDPSQKGTSLNTLKSHRSYCQQLKKKKFKTTHTQKEK